MTFERISFSLQGERYLSQEWVLNSLCLTRFTTKVEDSENIEAINVMFVTESYLQPTPSTDLQLCLLVWVGKADSVVSLTQQLHTAAMQFMKT